MLSDIEHFRLSLLAARSGHETLTSDALACKDCWGRLGMHAVHIATSANQASKSSSVTCILMSFADCRVSWMTFRTTWVSYDRQKGGESAEVQAGRLEACLENGWTAPGCVCFEGSRSSDLPWCKACTSSSGRGMHAWLLLGTVERTGSFSTSLLLSPVAGLQHTHTHTHTHTHCLAGM